MLFACEAAARQAGDSSDSPAISDATVSISGLLSIQPRNQKLESGPYLDGALGGVVPGISVALSTANAHGISVSFEASTTLAMSRMQSGRLVTGDAAVEGKHRDSLISILPGYRIGNDAGWTNLKAGISLVLGQSSRGGERLDHDIAGGIGITGGIDWVFRRRSFGFAPMLTYTYVLRGDENYYLGLGNHIVRAGVGFTWKPPS